MSSPMSPPMSWWRSPPGGPSRRQTRPDSPQSGNRSPLNKQDMLTEVGGMMESGADPATMTLGEMLSANGLDVNGPALTQISKFTDGILAGSDPMSQVDAIAGGENARMKPPGMPGGAPGGPGMPSPLGPGAPPPTGAPPPSGPGGGAPLPPAISQVLGE